MTGNILRAPALGLTALTLLMAGCSSSTSTSTGESSGSSGGASSGSSSGGSVGASGSGSGAGGGDDASSSGSSGGGAAGDDEDAAADASSRPASRDAAARDAASHDAAGGDATTASGDGGDPLAAARAQCVQIINQDRATLNPPSPPLQEDTAEEACVDGQAQADFEANTPHSAFSNCKESAQDECPNWPGPPSSIMTKCLAQMWAEGPPEAGDNHWLNMSNKRYKKVACGFYQTPSGKWWATQDFY